MNPDYIHQRRINLQENNCFIFFFFLLFLGFLKNKVVNGATFIEHNQLKEAIAYCSKCKTYLFETFRGGFDTFSDNFFIEARKRLI